MSLDPTTLWRQILTINVGVGIEHLGPRSDCVYLQRYRDESRYGSRDASVCVETYRFESSRARKPTADVVGPLLLRPLLCFQDRTAFNYQR